MEAPGGTAKKNEGPMRPLILMLTAMALVSCTAQPLNRHAQFNQEEYTSYGGFGTGIIYGEAFLTTRGGDVKKAATGDPKKLPRGSGIKRRKKTAKKKVWHSKRKHS